MPNILRSKGNEAMKFSQLIEYNVRNTFLQKSCRKWGKKTSFRPLFVFKIASYKVKESGLACKFIKKEALAQVFSCEFHEIFKNTFFTEHLRMKKVMFLCQNKSMTHL